MPRLTRYFVKTSFLYLLAGLLLGIALAAPGLAEWLPALGAMRPVYLHLLILGWAGQLIMGVMYWMFPKFTKMRPRGSEKLGWATYLSLNAGMALRIVGEPLVVMNPDLNAGWLLALSAIFLCVAGWCVVVNTWPRVKER